MGDASVVDLNEQKFLSRNKLCTDILAIRNLNSPDEFYSQGVTQTEQKPITSQVTRHEAESLHV